MNYFLKKCNHVAVIIVTILALLSGCMRPPEATEPSVQTDGIITTEPVRQLKEGIKTVLLLCLDQFDAPHDSGSYRNGNKADLILLMIIDEQLGKTTALQLNPDTMVSFSVPGMSEASDIPLGLVYSYGSGGSDSCLNELKAVSNLLGGIPIDHYLTFTADSIAIVNDMVGGVTVAATEDFLGEYPEFTEGENLTLIGEKTTEFFCFRDDGDVSNEMHMERQRQYMTGLYLPFVKNAQQEDFLAQLTLQLGDNLSTDLTLSQMVQMFESLEIYEPNETIVTLQGDAGKVDGQFQFYVDVDSLNQTVERLFFQ